MRFFYYHPTNHFIASPTRTGSTFLLNNCSESLVHLTDISKENEQITSDREIFKNQSQHRTFIYRDPVDRFLSWYKKFVVLDEFMMSQTISYSNFLRAMLLDNKSNNPIEDLYNSLDLIKQHHSKDIHTVGYSHFIDVNDIDLHQFNVINFLNFKTWVVAELNLTPVNQNQNYKHILEDSEELTYVPKNEEEREKLQEVVSTLKEIYKQDYELIAPLIKE
jgi:hypothetical protein